jgi:hypothetical protein
MSFRSSPSNSRSDEVVGLQDFDGTLDIQAGERVERLAQLGHRELCFVG